MRLQGSKLEFSSTIKFQRKPAISEAELGILSRKIIR